jgi:hypothetical protein
VHRPSPALIQRSRAGEVGHVAIDAAVRDLTKSVMEPSALLVGALVVAENEGTPVVVRASAAWRALGPEPGTIDNVVPGDARHWTVTRRAASSSALLADSATISSRHVMNAGRFFFDLSYAITACGS